MIRGCLRWLALALVLTGLLVAARLLWAVSSFWLLFWLLMIVALATGST